MAAVHHDQEDISLTMTSRLSTFMWKHKTDALEMIAKRLDKEWKAVKNWRHFSSQFEVEGSVIERYKCYGDFSPTIRVFEHLEIVQPDLTILQVKNALLEIGRTDMSILLDEVDGDQKACEAMTPTLLDDIALGLDNNAVGNWSKFASKLGVSKEDYQQFEIRLLEDPTTRLFEYLETKRPTELTLNELEDALRSDSMKRNNLANLLRDLPIDGNTLVRDVITPESDLLRKISNGLNREIAGTGNWRKLAYNLDVPREVYEQFETSEGQEKPSLTIKIMNWLVGRNPDITICDVVKVLTNIQRMDVVEIIRNVVGEMDLTGEMSKLRVNLDDDGSKQGHDQGEMDLTGETSKLRVNLDDDGSKQGHDQEDAAALPAGSSTAGSSTAGSSTAGSIPAGSSPQVFISYQWDQQRTVKELKKRLEKKGIHCWMDITTVGGGDSLRAEISDGIGNCKVFISCLTKKYLESDFCQREATLAQERKKQIIPLLLEDIRPWPPQGKLAVVFTDLIYIKISTPSGEILETKFAELLKQVDKFLNS